MTADPEALLREAVAVARRRGHAVTGASLELDDEGCSAWLWVLSGDEQRPLPGPHAIHATALEAAQHCLLLAGALPARPAPPPES